MKITNQCVICGKFRKWEELQYCAGDYSEVSGTFDEWFKCINCMSEFEKERFLKRTKNYEQQEKTETK